MRSRVTMTIRKHIWTSKLKMLPTKKLKITTMEKSRKWKSWTVRTLCNIRYDGKRRFGKRRYLTDEFCRARRDIHAFTNLPANHENVSIIWSFRLFLPFCSHPGSSPHSSRNSRKRIFNKWMALIQASKKHHRQWNTRGRWYGFFGFFFCLLWSHRLLVP